MGVAYNPVQIHQNLLSEEEIIKTLSGDDKTIGSCASAALTYVGQKAGMNVLDFWGRQKYRFLCHIPELEGNNKIPQN